jgi:hypothetical protein
MVTDWIDIVATIGLGIVGFYLAHNYRRQAKIRLAEARRTAYAELWQETGLAAPTRLDQEGLAGVLTPGERERLYQRFTTWYYQDGNGMLLEDQTRRMYLDAKHNLTCPDDQLRPPGLLEHFPEHMSEEQKRGCLSIRQLSLLRTQMKADLAIFGRPYVKSLREHERRFLEHCGVRLNRRPWRAATSQSPPAEDCGGQTSRGE